MERSTLNYSHKQAVNFAKQIIIKEHQATDSLTIHNDREDLLYYCNMHKIKVKEIMREAMGIKRFSGKRK